MVSVPPVGPRRWRAGLDHVGGVDGAAASCRPRTGVRLNPHRIRVNLRRTTGASRSAGSRPESRSPGNLSRYWLAGSAAPAGSLPVRRRHRPRSAHLCARTPRPAPRRGGIQSTVRSNRAVSRGSVRRHRPPPIGTSTVPTSCSQWLTVRVAAGPGAQLVGRRRSACDPHMSHPSPVL
jgi:hypothetical protein